MSGVPPHAGNLAAMDRALRSIAGWGPAHSSGQKRTAEDARHDMRAARPCGVAFRPRPDQEDVFELLLVHSGRPPEVVGAHAAEDIVAAWQALSEKAALPLLLYHDGSFETVYAKIGAVRLGAITIRRRHGFLAGRRPRFLVRRKTGRLSDRPVVWRTRD